jgi:hypothetical protein
MHIMEFSILFNFFESNMYVKVSRNLVTNAHSRVLCFIQFSESNMYVKVNVVEVV